MNNNEVIETQNIELFSLVLRVCARELIELKLYHRKMEIQNN